jgi:predicted negative regulator of RcsB-dependent stress response
MRAISPNLQNLLPWQQRLRAEEKQLSKQMLRNRSKSLEHVKKAGLTACLFCFSLCLTAQSFPFTTQHEKAYALLMDVKFNEARLACTDNSLPSQYITHLANAWELILTEDPALFYAYEQKLETQLAGLKAIDASTLFVKADLTLYWAFVAAMFGHEFEAFLYLRKAYQIAALCEEKYPAFVPVRKTMGLLQVVLGAVPEKYTWAVNLMGMEGSVDKGLANLHAASAHQVVGYEAMMLTALVQGYILQQSAAAMNGIEYVMKRYPYQASRMINASLALKNAQAEMALQVLSASPSNQLPILAYLRGEALLCKGEYPLAADAFQQFAQSAKGKNMIKDAHFKTGLCYQLLNNLNEANKFFGLAKISGNENSEADKYAARTLESSVLLNSQLLKIRFHIDGGFYQEALREIRNMTPGDLPTVKDQVEFYYRQARLAHKTNQPNAALLFYEQVVDMSGHNTWYFAPNACLQSGYLYLAENNTAKAKAAFEKALTYKKHEYKNSIDTKAKSALAQLNERR